MWHLTSRNGVACDTLLLTLLLCLLTNYLRLAALLWWDHAPAALLVRPQEDGPRLANPRPNPIITLALALAVTLTLALALALALALTLTRRRHRWLRHGGRRGLLDRAQLVGCAYP